MSDQTAPTGEDTGTPTAPEGTPEGTTETQTDDYQARIDKRLEEMGRSQQDALREFEERFSERFLPQDDDDEPEVDLDPDDPEYDQKLFEQWMQEKIDQEVQSALTPIQEQQQLSERNQRYEKLQDRFPELKDQEKAKPIVE